MRNLESNLQAECVRWFRYQYPKCIIFAIPNGGLRNIKTASRLKKEGALAGIPDLCIIGKSISFYVEMKYGKNTLSPAQKDMHQLMGDNNIDVFTINNFDAFMELCKNKL